MQEEGLVLSIHSEEASAHLVGSHASGVSILTVDDAFPFNENGGTLQIADDPTVWGYSDVDADNNIITLTGTTLVGYNEDDKVYVYPRGESLIAMVDIGDGTEPVRVLIPGHDKANWDEGIRDPDDQETVTIDDRSGRWEVVGRDQDRGELPYMERWADDAGLAATGGSIWMDIPLANVSSDSVGVEYTMISHPLPDWPEYFMTVPRTGKYAIVGKVQGGPYSSLTTANNDKIRFRVNVAGDTDYVYRMGNDRDADFEERAFAMLKRLQAGDVIRLQAQMINEQWGRNINGGKTATFITLAWLGE